MKVCILENDDLDPSIEATYRGYGAMFVRLFHDAGADWEFDIFHTPLGQYPESFDAYGAVVLTGSKADSFSDAPWVLELRRRVTLLLEQNKKLLGICFGHQLIALCLGAKVGRAPQGWGVGRMSYDWHAADLPLAPEDKRLALLVSHQDQVLELPQNAVLLASKAYADKNGLKPRARIIAMANMGDCPTLMLNAPVPAARKALAKAGLTVDDIDLWEINEAFAVVAEKFIRDLKLDRDKVNVNGGAIALGHPIGATGSMLIGTVLDELERRDLKRGLVTMCAAGGMAPAIIIERM
jgi:GMP synthase-like glutamine amidotransferase